MKRAIWTTIVCCLAASITSGPLFARGGHGGGGGGGGGGGAHVGGGGGGVAAHVGGAGAAHIGGTGAAHAVGGNGVQHFNGNTGNVIHSIPNAGNTTINQSPAFHHPNAGGLSTISGSPQIGHHPGFQNNSQSGFNGIQSGQIGGSVHNFGQINQGNNFRQNFNGVVHGGNNFGTQVQFSGHNHTGIAHQNFVGNTVNLGNRNINVANVGYRPAYYRHEGLYHGYWNGNRGYGGGYGLGYGGYGWGSGYGYGGYGYRPYFWGLGGWGLGSLMYGSGYLGYSNPYYTTAYSGVGYNYAQPIPVSYNQSAPVTVDPNALNGQNNAGSLLDSAVAAFRQNNYPAALDLTNQGIQQNPDDAVLHEFRALVLFAKGDYQQAAATIHSVLAVGPGWDWTTLSGIYADVGLYTTQLRALEANVKQMPEDGAARFLLAYHYLSDGYPDAAIRQLTKVVALVPNDQVAANLLKMTASQQAAPTSDSAAQPTPQPPVDLPAVNQTPPVQIDPSTVLGNWRASRDDGSSFALKLMPDKTFTWSFTPKQQPAQTFDGTYTLEGNVLALERTGGGSLVAEVTGNDGARFNFKMVGAPKEDPGLNFTK